MAKALTVQQFFAQFPSDDACLEHLFNLRFGQNYGCPKCGLVGSFHRLAGMPAYTCNCGHHVHPMVGTPFERSHTALQKWFYALYLFTTTRHGVSAKELQRQLGVTYKTAWRMGHEIRKYMAKVDGDDQLSGHVEIDETFIGGRKAGAGGAASKSKMTVLGMVERGGSVMTRHIHHPSRINILPHVTANIAKGSTVSTDAAGAYTILPRMGYDHASVNHNAGEYVRGHVHTNTIENFWSILKRSISSTHVWVSKKHLTKYLGEFEYRYNMRNAPQFMFNRLLASF